MMSLNHWCMLGVSHQGAQLAHALLQIVSLGKNCTPSAGKMAGATPMAALAIAAASEIRW